MKRAREKDADRSVHLTPDQREVLHLLRRNVNVLLLGSAGTGKSATIDDVASFYTHSLNKNVAKLAPTGIAAINIAGKTIQNALGMGGPPYTNTSSIIKRLRQNNAARFAGHRTWQSDYDGDLSQRTG